MTIEEIKTEIKLADTQAKFEKVIDKIRLDAILKLIKYWGFGDEELLPDAKELLNKVIK